MSKQLEAIYCVPDDIPMVQVFRRHAAGELVAEVFYEGDRLTLRVVGECDLPADEIAEIIRLAERSWLHAHGKEDAHDRFDRGERSVCNGAPVEARRCRPELVSDGAGLSGYHLCRSCNHDAFALVARSMGACSLDCSARGLWLLLGVAHHRHDSQWELLGTTGPDVPGLHGALSFSRCALSGDLGQELFPSRIILQMLCHTNSPCP